MHHRLMAAACGLLLGLGAQAQPGTGMPLFDDAGIPLLPLPRAIPAQPEYRTRSGLYATEGQALAHEDSHIGQVIRVRVACCGDQGVEDAMRDAWLQYVLYDASRDMPVFVRGDDLRQAAGLADRLGEAGFAPVFLVTVA